MDTTPSEHLPRWKTFLFAVGQSKPLYLIVVVLLIAISFWMGAGRRYLTATTPRDDIVQLQKVDVDYHVLYPSIEAKRTFLSTFNWWHEPWRADAWVGAYWRPLTMQAWWLEAHVFGEDRSYNWMRFSLLLMVVFDLLLLYFLWQLTKNKFLALAGLALFALPSAWFHAVNPLCDLARVNDADLMIVQGWKDQPDLFANIFVFAALILALKNRWALALACTAAAIGFKESGLMVFPLAALVIWPTQGIRRIPWWVYVASGAMLVLMMVARWFAGPLVFAFHSYGRDVGGLARYMNAMLPLGLSAVSSAGETLVGAGVFGLLLWRPKNLLVWLGVVLGLFVAGVALVGWQESLTLDVAFAQLLDQGAVPMLLLIVWLVLMAALWTQKTYFKWAMILAACAFVSALSFALATQAALHVLALARAFQAGYGACVVFGVGAAVVRRLDRRSNVFQGDVASG